MNDTRENVVFNFPFSNNRTHNHSLNNERAKIALQFALMSICSAVLGVLLSKVLPESFYVKSAGALFEHFGNIFKNCSEVSENLYQILSYALSDIILVAVIFCVSFAVFNYAVSDIVLVYSGLKTSFAISFLSKYLSNTDFSYSISWIEFTVFVIFKLLIMLVIWDYAYKAAAFSPNLKKINSLGRSAVNTRTVFSFFLSSLIYFGTIIILNSLYCYLIYIIK